MYTFSWTHCWKNTVQIEPFLTGQKHYLRGDVFYQVFGCVIGGVGVVTQESGIDAEVQTESINSGVGVVCLSSISRHI